MQEHQDDEQYQVERSYPVTPHTHFIESWRPYVKYFPGILAWLSAILGVLIVFGSVISPMDFTGTLLGVGAALPGIWWIRCNGADKKAQRDHHRDLVRRQELKMLMGDDVPEVSQALDIVHIPLPMERHWGTISIISLSLIFLSAILS